MKLVKKKNKKGFALMAGVTVVVLSTFISSMTTMYTSLHKTIEKNGVEPLGISIAQDRINDIANKNFYEQYQKAQSNTVVPEIKDSDGNKILVGDKYNVSTKFSNATTCNGELCYTVTIDIKENGSDKIWYTSSEIVTESQSGRGIPIGTVLAYKGDLSKLPYGWEVFHAMDNRFTKGSNFNNIGGLGGTANYVLKPENMPSYSFNVTFDSPMIDASTSNMGYNIGTPEGAVGSTAFHSCEGGGDGTCDGSDGDCVWRQGYRKIYFKPMSLSVNVNEWTDTPFVMEPAFYKVAYIIKTKEVK